MQLAQFVKSYRQAAVASATPGQLILMLFDGALRSMAIALDGFKEEDPVRRNEKIHNKLVNAHDIILELQTSLDLKVPGDFSRRAGIESIEHFVGFFDQVGSQRFVRLLAVPRATARRAKARLQRDQRFK